MLPPAGGSGDPTPSPFPTGGRRRRRLRKKVCGEEPQVAGDSGVALPRLPQGRHNGGGGDRGPQAPQNVDQTEGPQRGP